MRPEKKSDKTYILELSDAQAKLVETALEEYFRLRMGQYFDFADEMAFQGFNYKEHTDEEFDERMKRKERLQAHLEKMKTIIWPPFGFINKKTEEQENAIDIWHVIRHVRYLANGGDINGMTTAASRPFQCGTEPLPKMRVKEAEK